MKCKLKGCEKEGIFYGFNRHGYCGREHMMEDITPKQTKKRYQGRGRR